MSRGIQLITLFASLLLGTTLVASEGGGVSPKASSLIDLGAGWSITNSMITGWIVSALLVTLVLWLVG